jgi:hypothetical protein
MYDSQQHHLGHSQWKQTPSGLGFDEFVGCFMWDIDSYKKQMYESPWHPLALDWVQTFANKSYHHFAEPRHATEAITWEAQRMVAAHREQHSDQPLFMYVAYTAAHSPLQPMPQHEDACRHVKHLWRRQFCGMVVGLDEGLKNLTQTVISELGSDTIFVFSSDNGGSTWFGGLNAPFRGGKSTPLEGGVRVPAFAVDFSEDGRYLGEGGWTYEAMVHVADWFPTLASIAGDDLEGYKASGGEGIDMSGSIRRRDQHGHRQEALLEMYDSKDFIYDESLVAFVLGDMKLIEGVIRDPLYYYESDIDFLNNTDRTAVSALGQMGVRVGEGVFGAGPFDTTRVLITHSHIHPLLLESGKIPSSEPGSSLLLFNLTADPTESQNIAHLHPGIVAEIRAKLAIIKAKLPKQQKFWMQSHLRDVWPKTHVSGDCSMNPAISAAECHFTHPWVLDSQDPWDQPLVHGSQYGDERLHAALIKLAGILGAAGLLLFGVVWFTCCRHGGGNDNFGTSSAASRQKGKEAEKKKKK